MSDDATAAVAVHALQKSFGEVIALDGLNLEVRPGTVFGLLGPNGAGKTTLVRVVSTLLEPDGGHASLCSVTTSSPSRSPCDVGSGWPASCGDLLGWDAPPPRPRGEPRRPPARAAAR